MKLATYKIKLPHLAKMAKISADEYFLCVGYEWSVDIVIWSLLFHC